jgi:hypothetical protein
MIDAVTGDTMGNSALRRWVVCVLPALLERQMDIRRAVASKCYCRGALTP